MSRLRYLLLALVLVFPIISANSAPSRPVINVNNVDQLQKVRFLGKGIIGDARWSPDGNILAVGSTTGVWLYDTHNFQRAPRWLGNRDFAATQLAFSPDGRKLVSYNRLSKISIWNVNSQHLEREVTLDNQGYVPVTNTGSGLEYSPVFDVSFTAQNQLLVTSELPKGDGFHVWDAYTRQDVVKGNSSDISSVSYSPDGQTVAFGMEHDLDLPGEIELWSLKTGKLMSTLTGPTSPINSVAYSRDGSYLASASGAVPSDYADDQNDNTARVWDAKTGKVLRILAGHAYWVGTVAFSPNNQLLASGSGDNTIRLWNVRTGQLRATLKGHTGWIGTLAFSPNGRWLASTSGDGTLRIWDTWIGLEVAREADFSGDPDIYVGPGGSGSSFDFAFGPDAVTIGAILGGSTFKIWNGLDGKELPAPTFPKALFAQDILNAFSHPNIIKHLPSRGELTPEKYLSAKFSSNLNYMLVTSDHTEDNSRSTQLWSVNPQKLIADLPYDPFYETAVFSPDSQLVIIMTINSRYSDYETSIIAIDAATGQEAYRSTRPPFQFSGQGRVVNWRFSADGTQLGAIWNDGYFTVNDVKTGWRNKIVDLRSQGDILGGEFSSDLAHVAYSQDQDVNKLLDVGSQRVSNVSGYPQAFTMNDQVLFTSDENKVLAWDVTTGQLLGTFYSRRPISWLRLNQNSTILAMANDDDVIETWAIPTQ